MSNRLPKTSPEALRKRRNIRFDLAGRVLSVDEMLALLAKQPAEVAQSGKRGLTVKASPAVLAAARATALAPFIEADGDVETQALTGLEEALIVIAAIGFFSGLAVGYLKGYEDSQQDAAAETEGEADGEGGEDTGGDAEGGQDGGDGEGR